MFKYAGTHVLRLNFESNIYVIYICMHAFPLIIIKNYAYTTLKFTLAKSITIADKFNRSQLTDKKLCCRLSRK